MVPNEYESLFIFIKLTRRVLTNLKIIKYSVAIAKLSSLEPKSLLIREINWRKWEKQRVISEPSFKKN